MLVPLPYMPVEGDVLQPKSAIDQQQPTPAHS